MRVLSVINQKGGVGKTTTTVNLGAALAAHERRVLLVDLDPQANLGTHLSLEAEAGDPTIYDVLVRGRALEDAVYEIRSEGLWLAPSSLDLSAAELELATSEEREVRLDRALKELVESVPFDDVLLDCPPSLGLLTINALAASTEVLVPLQTEFFALQGMAKLMEVIELIRTRINPRLHLRGIVACKVDKRPRLTQEVLAEVSRHFGDRLFETQIRPNVKLAEAPSHGSSVLSYAPQSNGALDYGRLACELLGLPLRSGDEEYEYVYEDLPPTPEDREQALAAEIGGPAAPAPPPEIPRDEIPPEEHGSFADPSALPHGR